MDKTKQQKTVWIPGGSGLIGQIVARRLIDNGYRVTIVTRSVDNTSHFTQVTWDELCMIEPPMAVVNLCGESINGRLN